MFKYLKAWAGSGDKPFRAEQVSLAGGGVDDWVQEGFEAYQAEQWTRAREQFERVLGAEPMHADALYLLGEIARREERQEEAIELIGKAIAVNGGVPAFHFSLGCALQTEGKTDKAQACYHRAVELDSDYPEAYLNLGFTHECQGDIASAIACYGRAADLNLDLALARLNKARLMLLRGEFEEGWKNYEARWSMEPWISQAGLFPKPRWNGSVVPGKTILLHVEQGHGDTFQFVRYAPLIAERCAKVILVCLPSQKALLKSMTGIEQLVAGEETVPEYDLQLPLLSTPFVFKTDMENIPARIPYLAPPSHSVDKWARLLPDDGSHIKVGIVWATSGGNKENFSRRSCTLSMFAPLAKVERVKFYSLQMGDEAQQASNPPDGMQLKDLTSHIENFADTAALIERLDLVISVDTSVAHLTGALAKPVWTLIPYVPGWRWLLDREDSPWYPTMRLFRQARPGEWGPVLERVALELSAWTREQVGTSRGREGARLMGQC